jgi:predicted lipoprotein with Yx(FWY)xxD motif
MQRRLPILVVLFALSLVLAACGAQGAPQSSAYGNAPAAAATAMPPTAAAAVPVTGATSAPAAAAAPSGPAHVALGKDAQLGSFLVDDKGMTLYLYTKDTPNTSSCYGKCATAWPPLLTSGTAVGADGLDASKFGTTTRTDGTVQVTYNGWPLYYFAKDKQAGDVTGQKVGSVWFVVSPTGDAVK